MFEIIKFKGKEYRNGGLEEVGDGMDLVVRGEVKEGKVCRGVEGGDDVLVDSKGRWWTLNVICN
tara:strand:+ start:13032 stop:13223 length:192 start_codon:yes stop_codon:yes gene_type:complete